MADRSLSRSQSPAKGHWQNPLTFQKTILKWPCALGLRKTDGAGQHARQLRCLMPLAHFEPLTAPVAIEPWPLAAKGAAFELLRLLNVTARRAFRTGVFLDNNIPARAVPVGPPGCRKSWVTVPHQMIAKH
jgi:hypothetical protein